MQENGEIIAGKRRGKTKMSSFALDCAYLLLESVLPSLLRKKSDRGC